MMENQLQKPKKNKIYFFSVIISLIMLVVMHIGFYKLSVIFIPYVSILEYIPKLPVIDDLIPIVSVFSVPYLLAYPFWLFCGFYNSKASRRRYADYIIGFTAAYFVGFIILCLFPAVMDRNAEGLFELLAPKTDIFSKMHYFIIADMDPGDIAHGLLPSFHCLSSAFCALGVVGCKEIPKGMRIFIEVFALSIIIATQVLKQHYLMDLVAGCGIAIIFYLLSRKFHWGRIIEPLLAKFDGQGEISE